MLDKTVILEKINKALGILRNYGISCELTPEEFLKYVTAPTLTGDTIHLNDIIENDLLILHEVAEICEFKKKGISIDKNIFIKHPDLAYELHLKAMKIELDYAYKKKNYEWIKRRLEDINSYLKDPNLPDRLKEVCLKLLASYRAILPHER